MKSKDDLKQAESTCKNEGLHVFDYSKKVFFSDRQYLKLCRIIILHKHKSLFHKLDVRNLTAVNVNPLIIVVPEVVTEL